MRLVSLIAIVLVCGVARADDLVASASRGRTPTLFIDRIAGDKLVPVYSEPLSAHGKPGAYAWAWGDAKTLWVLRRDGDRIRVGKVTGDSAAPDREITLADWNLRSEPIPRDEGDPSPGLLVTKTGVVFATKCLTRRGDRGCKLGYLRIDVAAPVATRGQPEAVVTWPPGSGTPKLPEAAAPAVAAPTGYAASIKTVKIHGTTFVGVVCEGPHDSYSWPEILAAPSEPIDAGTLAAFAAKGRVTRVDWIAASPALMRYTVMSSWGTYMTYVEDCKAERPAPQRLADGRWLDGEIVRDADGSERVRLRGNDAVEVAPR